MPSFDLKKEMPAFERWLKKGLADGVAKGLHSTALRMVSDIVNQVIPAENPPPVFDRVYAAGWRAEKTKGGADVVNTVPYASVIEYGARAENVKIGRKMIDALTEWVRRKGLVGRAPRSAAGKVAHVAAARNAAWAIAVAMKKRGIFNRGSNGLRIGEKGLARAKEYVGEEVSREIARATGGR